MIDDCLTPEQRAIAQDAAEMLRVLLLSLPDDLIENVLRAAEICLHCGADERGSQTGCQCWNDE